MHDSADTSASAASNRGSSSPAGSSGVSGSPAGGPPDAQEAQWLRVDFYILQGASAHARLKLACRLAEKAYLSAQSPRVWHTDADELKTFDEMLWTLMYGSFVPHEMLTADASSDAVPVLLSAGSAPPADVDTIINLAPDA